MTTEYATNMNGLDWTWQGTALCGRPGEWDARGTRVTAVRLAGAVGHRVLRRPGQRRVELRGADRGRHRHRPGGADRHVAAGRGTRRVLALPPWRPALPRAS